MSVIGTYNGANVIALPTKPGFREVELAMNDTNAMSNSPYTGKQQIQAWPGADWWEASISMPPLTLQQAAVWSAWLSEMRGMLNCFLLGDGLRPTPYGVANNRDKPVVNGVTNAMSLSLTTRGWRPNEYRLLLPGDYLQIGATPPGVTVGDTRTLTPTQPALCRLHRVLEEVDSDSNGNATITVWPSVRESTVDATQIVLNNPRGIFRLADNRRAIMSSFTKLSQVTFKAVEAR